MLNDSGGGFSSLVFFSVDVISLQVIYGFLVSWYFRLCSSSICIHLLIIKVLFFLIKKIDRDTCVVLVSCRNIMLLAVQNLPGIDM